VARFLREHFTRPGSNASRRIFLSREGFRRDLVNRSEVEQVLLARGFEICRPHIDDALRACTEAGIIVGQEGANLMNSLVAPPGTSVLMLLPEAHENLPYAFTGAAAAGHNLYVQSCQLEEATPGREGTSPVRADPAVLAAGVDRILAITQP
jgi:capsular polysaccharide biosynthesis protein